MCAIEGITSPDGLRIRQGWGIASASAAIFTKTFRAIMYTNVCGGSEIFQIARAIYEKIGKR